MSLQPSAAPSPGGPIAWFLKLFSSIWLGVFLLFLLFVYSSVGSAGMPTHWNLLAPSTWVLPRHWRSLEMTEFEWFHWWPFDLLIGLICLNLVVATLRRIPFKVVNLGVWMIHAGIIILCIGSVIYFTAKVEGDTPVLRRQVLIEVPGEKPVGLPVIPGARTIVGSGANQYEIMVASTDPAWELLTEPYKGQRVYSVNVRVASPEREFIRQLIWGHEDLTEDVIRTTDPEQPFKRAVKMFEDGRRLVDTNLTLKLAHRPQDSFCLMNSAAIYIREEGSRHWVQRPLKGLPHYNDYLPSLNDAWLDALPPNEVPPVDPLDLRVDASHPQDPLAGQEITVSGFLRYATMDTRPVSGGSTLNPMTSIELRSGGSLGTHAQQYQLMAFHVPRNQLHVGLGNGKQIEVVRFLWLQSEAELAPMIEVRTPMLSLKVPEFNVDASVPLERFTQSDPQAPFIPIEGTPYAWRANYVADELRLTSTLVASLVSVEVKTPQGTFERWVFDDSSLTRDFQPQAAGDGAADPNADPHAQFSPPDPRIVMAYSPGASPPPVMLVAGPDEGSLRVVSTTREGQAVKAAKVGDEVPVAPEVRLKVLDYSARTSEQTRPAIVPRAQRDASMTANLSMIQVRIPGASAGDESGGESDSFWLPYHHYPAESFNDALRLFAYRPQSVKLADGRLIQVMFSRESRPLPAPVVLDEFLVREEIGGYADSSLSVRDWESRVLFEEPSDPAGWSRVKSVSMNAPAEHEGYWFFQSQWDPPRAPQFEGDLGSSGLNYTVLGVGNREGVHTQLAGCCIAVTGMIYAFYWKPVLKRRKQQQALRQAAQAAAPRAAVSPPSEKQFAAAEDRT